MLNLWISFCYANIQTTFSINFWQPTSINVLLHQHQSSGKMLFLASYDISILHFEWKKSPKLIWVDCAFAVFPISDEWLNSYLFVGTNRLGEGGLIWLAWLVIPNLCVFCPPLPLQEEGFTGFMRTLRGRDQEKVIRKKEELWGPARSVFALWPLTSLPPPARALRALTWETQWPQWKAIFLFPSYSRLLWRRQST